VKQTGLVRDHHPADSRRLNDSDAEFTPGGMDRAANWVRMCRLHFTAFHPDWKLDDLPPTPPATLQPRPQDRIDAGLHYVYTGNVHDQMAAHVLPEAALPCVTGTPADRIAARRDWYEPFGARRIPIAMNTPLEAEASGLVVFTQDWRIVRKLTEDAATVEHELVVEVAGDLAACKTPEGIKRLNRVVAFNGRTPTSLKVSWQNESRLRVALKGAQIGHITKLCEAVGLQVLTMKRLRLGGVSMGKVPVGQWRYLRANERF
jgi:hypothetical protein